MKNYRMIFCCILMFLLTLPAEGVGQEEMTLTTYYPAPYGDYCRLLVSSLPADVSTKETYTKSSVSANYFPVDSFFDIFTKAAISTADTNQDEAIDETEFLAPADSFFDIFIEISGVTKTEVYDSFFDIFVDVAFSKIDANLDGMIDKTELSLCCGDSFFDIFVEIEIDLKGTLGDTHMVEELELAIEKVEKAGIYLPDVCPDTDNDGIIDGLDNCPAEQVVRVYDASGAEVYIITQAMLKHEMSMAAIRNIKAAISDGQPGDNIGVLIRGISKEELKSLIADGFVRGDSFFDVFVEIDIKVVESGSGWIEITDESTSEIVGYLWIPQTYNPDQSDIDGDGTGDVCDSDADGDLIEDMIDNCMFFYNPDQSDFDKDGIGDVCDSDDDNDRIPDTIDRCPLENPQGLDANIDGCLDRIEDLPDNLEDMDIQAGVKESLLAKVNNASSLLTAGEINAAINILEAFINQVEAQFGKKISPQDATVLAGFAQNIIRVNEGDGVKRKCSGTYYDNNLGKSGPYNGGCTHDGELYSGQHFDEACSKAHNESVYECDVYCSELENCQAECEKTYESDRVCQPLTMSTYYGPYGKEVRIYDHEDFCRIGLKCTCVPIR